MRKKFTCYRCGKYVETEMDDNGDATCPACENVIELEPERRFQTRIASLESELADAQARLAGYEVGFDPATNPPKDMEQVLFVDEYGEFYRGGFDSEGKYWWQTVVITSAHISGQGGEIPQETIIRWFPLPGSKGGEA